MFVIKYDKVSMIKLVQCIEKYPAIYDSKKHYSKDELDNSWDKVALEVGEKDSLCREKWHSIRSCYIRHLKYTALNSKRRPYYLAEFLNFLLPHVSDKVRAYLSLQQYEIENLPSYLREALPQAKPLSSYFSQSIRNEKTIEIKTEVVDIEDASETEWLRVNSESQQPSSSHTSIKKSSPDLSFRPSKKRKAQQFSDSNDDDINFFKSLLPDIAKMSSHQKLKFKQETLSIVEDILYANDDVDVTE